MRSQYLKIQPHRRAEAGGFCIGITGNPNTRLPCRCATKLQVLHQSRRCHWRCQYLKDQLSRFGRAVEACLLSSWIARVGPANSNCLGHGALVWPSKLYQSHRAPFEMMHLFAGMIRRPGCERSGRTLQVATFAVVAEAPEAPTRQTLRVSFSKFDLRIPDEYLTF